MCRCRVEHRQVAVRLLQLETLSPMGAPIPSCRTQGSRRGLYARGEPHPSSFVHHRVMCERLAVPDRLGAPVRGRSKRIVLRGRRLRVAHRMLDLGDPVRARLEDGSRSVLSFGGAYTFPLALTRGFRRSVEMASCRYAVGATPVPQRDHEVALDALRALRPGKRQFAAAMRSVQSAKSVRRPLAVKPVDVARHQRPGAA